MIKFKGSLPWLNSPIKAHQINLHATVTHDDGKPESEGLTICKYIVSFSLFT